ncbi:MAG: hypothetical protein J1E41_00400, partial [Ruminococcus sp.]|nr:hypothetical protein [Ruminococcus sp.]
MKNLKSAFKPTPERFSYSVEESIKEAEFKVSKKSKLSRTSKIFAVSLAALIAIPCGAFAVTKISSMVTKQVGKYGVELNVDKTSEKNSPKYVKLKVDVPKGFKTYVEDMKYQKVPESADGYFSLWLMRPSKGNLGEILTDVESYKEIEINGHTAIVINDTENPVNNGSMRMAVYFENVDIVLEAFVGSDITEKEALNFLKNIQVIKGTKSEHTEYETLGAENHLGEDKEEITYSINTEYVVKKQNEKINLVDDYYTVSLSNARVLDNVKELDRKSFYFWNDDVSDYINSDGTLKPRTREKWKWGDGLNTKDEKVNSSTVSQKFVLVDVTYTNNTDEETETGLNISLRAMQNNNGKLSTHSFYEFDPNADDGRYQYRKGHICKPGKDDFYYFTLKPN